MLTLRRIWHRRKYGTSTLVMDTIPARPSQTLEARLQTSVAPSDAPGNALQVQLPVISGRQAGTIRRRRGSKSGSRKLP